MFSLLKYLRKKYYLFILMIIGFSILQVFCDLKLPEILQEVLSNVTPGGTADKSFVLNKALIMLGIAVASMTCTIFVTLLASKIAAGFSHDVRKQIYIKVENFSMSEIDSFSTSSLITRSTNDITQVQMLVVMVLRMAVSAPIYGIYGIIKTLEIKNSTNLSFIIIGAIIVLILLVCVTFAIVLPKFNKVQKLTDRLNMVTRESLTGIRVIRASNATNQEEEKFKIANTNITKNNIFINRATSIFMPGVQFIMNMTSLLILLVAAILINGGKFLNIADVIQIQQYSLFIVIGFMQLTILLILAPRGFVSAKRIKEVLKSNTLIKDIDNPVFIDEVKTIEFKNVSFKYGEASEYALSNLSFKIEKGQTFAIIGGTGDGKSSILHLLNRFYDVTDGEILINGINIKNISQKNLHDLFGYVPQKALLFSGTIRSNLSFGQKAPTEEEIKRALDISQAIEFVSKIGFDAPVSQGGMNFSGGQKQRLCIARAVIKNANVLMFDDSFSALDLKTDKALRSSLNENMTDTTKIIVAQRVGTIISADNIIVLDKGKIVGLGTHNELLKDNDIYQEIAYSQLSKEELHNA